MLNKGKIEKKAYKYEMVIERGIIERLGLKLYDKVSAVVAEIIANSYDADAELVEVFLPLGKALAMEKEGKIEQKGYTIEVRDNGHGMTPEEANEFYLRVGKARREDVKQGNFSREKRRKVMGRKGIGKLAPFGVCKTIEVYSAGGEGTEKGYRITHFELNFDEILKQTDDKDPNYHPKSLDEDGKWSKKRGTIIRLKDFLPRKVPDKDTFSRQLSYRFMSLPKFKIKIVDTKEENSEKEFFIEPKDISIMKGTKIVVDDRPIIIEPGKELHAKGWIALAQKAYKNVEFAGVRIYTRGKIASITRDFGLPSGFMGEYVARSYLVGEIKADWIDEEEDLIQTHRQDMLWGTEEGQAFSKWGQELIKEVARRGRGPRRKKVKDEFLKVSNIKEIAQSRFSQKPEIVRTALELAEKIGGFASEDELFDTQYISGLRDFILSIAPHKLFVDTLKEISKRAPNGKISINELIKLFDTTRIAELTSYGQIVTEKLEVIDVFQQVIRREDPPVREKELQEILEDAPWLIDPRWVPITSNRSFKNFRDAFEAWYKKKYKVKIITSTNFPYKGKKPDFVLLHVENSIKILEIKPPKYVFKDEDWLRLKNYDDAMEGFLNEHPRYKEHFHEGFQIILVTNEIKLQNSSFKEAKESLQSKRRLKIKNWEELLDEVKNSHQSFLDARDSFE